MPWVVLTVSALVVLLLGEVRKVPSLRSMAKPVASLGFVALAVEAGALAWLPGQVLLGGLALAWVGDVCLLGRSRLWFLAGLGAFLAGHLAYALAFVLRGQDWLVGGLALAALLVPAAVVWRWLRPHVPEPMARPVGGYVLAITVMLASAVGAVGAGDAPGLVIGAAAFYLSDLAVARQRFVAPGVENRLWGLPLYYAGQLLLAAAAGPPG